MAGQRRTKDSLSRAHRASLTPHRKRAFLEALRACGVATRAAREASPNARGASVVSTFKDERARDSKFAAAWDEALEAHAGDLLAELYRRAMIGDSVPIVSPKGEVVGWRTIRSDKLLLEAVRAHVPEFTPRSEVTADVRSRVSQEPLHLDTLSPESQDQLREILEREQSRRLGEPRSNGPAPYRSLPMGDGYPR